MCSCSPESQWNPGLHQKQCGQQGKGVDSTPLLCSLGPHWSMEHSSHASNIRRTWNSWNKPTGDHKVEKRMEAPPLWGQAERVGAFHPGEEKVTWQPSSIWRGFTREPWRDSLSGWLDKTLSSLVSWDVSLHMAGALGVGWSLRSIPTP